jgi:hypothetical protein
MEKHNIWETLDLTKNTPNVYKELKNQAAILADKSNGVLYAEINPVDAYNEITLDRGIFYNFYIYAPYLGNFRSMLFRVVDTGNKIIVIDEVNERERREANNIPQLIDIIESIIKSNEVSKLISNLYASSMEVKK